MVQTAIVKPLGTVLLRGGLISPAQVEVALVDQRNYPNMRIGDVLELRGWLDRTTLDFFSDQWPKLVAKGADHPIGVYLQQAGLITQKQLDTLLDEQLQTGLRVGSLAVLRGWIKQETLDLLLQGIAPKHQSESAFQSLRQAVDAAEEDNSQADMDLLAPGSSPHPPYPSANDIPEEDIPWVD